MRNSRLNQNKEVLSENCPGILEAKVERGEFLRKACTLAGGFLLAGSLGALTGCNRETATGVDSRSSAETIVPESRSSSNTSSNSTDPSGAISCRFNDNGTCSKTGGPCTNCMD